VSIQFGDVNNIVRDHERFIVNQTNNLNVPRKYYTRTDILQKE